MKKILSCILLGAFSLPALASAAVVKFSFDSAPHNEGVDVTRPGVIDPYLGQSFTGHFVIDIDLQKAIGIAFNYFNPNTLTVVYKDLSNLITYHDTAILSQAYTFGHFTFSDIRSSGPLELSNGIVSKWIISADGTNSIGENAYFVSSNDFGSSVQFLDSVGEIGYVYTDVDTTFSLQTITPVPEPETFALLSAGIALLGAARRKNS